MLVEPLRAGSDLLQRLAIVWLSLVVFGCAAPPVERSGSPDPRPASVPVHRSDPGQRIANLARSLVGTPYRYGGSTPTQGFDCSGLVYYTHGAVGIGVPRTSKDQYQRAAKLPLGAAKPGDLVFFSDQKKLSHVAIYVGGGRFIHAPSSGKVVSEAHLDQPYYQRHLVGVGRLY